MLTELTKQKDIAFKCIGGVSPSIINSIYPMENLTKIHYALHLERNLTSRWMDYTNYRYIQGTYHRLAGHHLFEDGFRVLISDRLKFGDFLHHLGCDLLTSRGIPNPLLPSILGEKLIALGLSKRFVYEIMTINIPKLLSGSLCLVCSGMSIYACFSDAIPHSFLSAGAHFGLGVMDIVAGVFPGNFLLLTAGAAEIGVGSITTYRAFTDPILPYVNVPKSVFLPALSKSITYAALIGACASIFSGDSWIDTANTIVSSSAASVVSTSTTFAAAKCSHILAPFLGPIAGIISFLIINKIFKSLLSNDKEKYIPYLQYSPFSQEQVFPFLEVNPIGVLKNDRLLLDENLLNQRWN